MTDTSAFPFPSWPCVYVVTADERRVKIGQTSKLARRLVTLQNGSPDPLRVLAVMPGGVAEERWLHREFRSSRIHGEWFDLSPTQLERLMRFMAALSPGRVETKGQRSELRSPKPKRPAVPPEVAQAAVDHVNHWFTNAEIVLGDRVVMAQLERNIARRMRREGRL